jgi:hypothetical protein
MSSSAIGSPPAVIGRAQLINSKSRRREKMAFVIFFALIAESATLDARNVTVASVGIGPGARVNPNSG